MSATLCLPMGGEAVIVSNNPLVWKNSPCVQVEGSPIDVLARVINMLVTQSYSLYAHPIAGNARLLKNPYRTLILYNTPAKSSDNIALHTCLNALEHLERLTSTPIPQHMHHDYALVDWHLFQSQGLVGEYQ